jgi:hypothetical protein
MSYTWNGLGSVSGGLGAIPTAAPTVPGEDNRFDTWWDYIPLSQIRSVQPTLAALYGLGPGAIWPTPPSPGAEPQGEIGELQYPVVGLKLLWTRLGRRPAWWPGGRDEFNFGPTTHMPGWGGSGNMWGSNSNAIRISREFRLLLDQLASLVPNRQATERSHGRVATFYPPELWMPSANGYVHLRVDDPLLEAIRVRRLVPGGFVAANEQVSVKDDSPFVQGLYKLYLERLRKLRETDPNAVLQDRDRRDWWPQGINFGPNVGNEVRIHPSFLSVLLNEPTEREKAAATAIAGMEVRPPIFGGLPSLAFDGKPTWLQPSVTLAKNKVASATRLMAGTQQEALIQKAAAALDTSYASVMARLLAAGGK